MKNPPLSGFCILRFFLSLFVSPILYPKVVNDTVLIKMLCINNLDLTEP